MNRHVTASILEHIDAFTKEHHLNLSSLAKLAGLNAGTLSSILKKNKVLTTDHLDRLTAVMELPEGYFYPHYIHEYLKNTIPDWRRFRPFIYRCAELDKLDCLEQVINLLMENLTYSPLLFDVAEDLFANGKHAAAALLYESVAVGEKQQHSERLAFCQYRLFLIRQGTDQHQNYQAAIQFEPYIERLDECTKLDALRDLCNTYRALQQWDKVLIIADKLESVAKLQYFAPCRTRKGRDICKPSRPLFSYIAITHLFRADVCDAYGDYEQALHYTKAYADLDWVRETDEETEQWKAIFQNWAQANIYVNQLLSGNINILCEYLTFIEEQQEEIIPALFNIMEAANRYWFDVDFVLQRYSQEIAAYIDQPWDTEMNLDPIQCNTFSLLLHNLAYYHLSRHSYSTGFKYLLTALEKLMAINNKTCIIRCMGLFEQYRDWASSEILSIYKKLVKGVYANEESSCISIVVS